MRTLKLLSTAKTREQALTALQQAAEQKWPEASIRRHASKTVLSLMANASQVSGGGKRALKQQAPRLSLPVAPAVTTRVRRPKASEIAFAHKVPATLTRDGDTQDVTLALAEPRKKLVQRKDDPSKFTIDAMIGGDHFTISEDGMKKLVAGGTYRVHVKGHGYELALVQS
jgi:hypothetical protein